MEIIIKVYIVVFILFFLKSSKKGTIYLFSPLIIIHMGWIINDIIPVLVSPFELSKDIEYVVTYTTLINLLSLFIFRKQFNKKAVLEIPSNTFYLNKKRIFIILFIFIPLLLLSGILSGVTQGLLSGVNVEGLRRTGEIGLGFIREIPQLGIQLILLVLFLQYKPSGYVKVGFYCILLAIFLFMISGHKAAFVQAALLFLLFLHFKYRGLRWYEYILYLLLIPIAAGLLQGFREGDLSLIPERILLFFSYPLVLYRDTTIPIMDLVSDGNYFYGEEYFAGLVKIIPRFLWEEKPLSFDYTLKEMVGANFEGGGIYVSVPFSFFINFGYYYWLFNAIWICFIHYLYSKLVSNTCHYYYKIISLFLLFSGSIALTISNIELMLIIALFCYFIYGRKKVI